MPHKRVAFILIIRVSYDLTVMLIWIIASPDQNIGRGFQIFNGDLPRRDRTSAILILLPANPETVCSGNPYTQPSRLLCS